MVDKIVFEKVLLEKLQKYPAWIREELHKEIMQDFEKIIEVL